MNCQFLPAKRDLSCCKTPVLYFQSEALCFLLSFVLIHFLKKIPVSCVDMSGDDLHDEMLSCDTYVLISDSNVADP